MVWYDPSHQKTGLGIMRALWNGRNATVFRTLPKSDRTVAQLLVHSSRPSLMKDEDFYSI